MEKQKITTITSETHEVLVFRRLAAPPIRAWCAGCSAEAEMTTPGEGSIPGGVSERTIYSWVDSGKVHFAETPDGLLLICQKSLTEQLARPPLQISTEKS